MPASPRCPSRPTSAAILTVMVPLSLVLTAATNRIAGCWLTDHAPSFAWMATTALSSCLTIVILYALIGTADALRWRSLPAH